VINPKTLFRWEQDGAGGDHGTATYFPHTDYEVTVTLPWFTEAHKLQMCIEAAISQARWEARRDLLAEIGRIKP
jgi:hypothetical protein